MSVKQGSDIVRRCRGNPIITVDDIPFRCADIMNAGAIKANGAYVLLLTIQSLAGSTAIYKARSSDGYTFEVDDRPFIAPVSKGPGSEYTSMGVLDPRITPMDGKFYITYDVSGPHGYRLAIAATEDFKDIEPMGFVSLPDTKAGALFPEKINGRYARLERPWHGGSIWVSYSDDLVYWGWGEAVMTPRGGFWDPSRIGAATPPMRIDEGWLFIYYGAKDTSAGPLFRLGAAVLDLANPAEVVYRTNIPILGPREDYERIGDIPNLVFPCGAVLEPDGEMKVYYGAANSCICVGVTKVDDILAVCRESDKEF